MPLWLRTGAREQVAQNVCVDVAVAGNAATITVAGRLEDANVRLFERELEKLAEHNVTRLTIEAAGLTAVSTGAIRALLMQRQRLELGDQQDVVLNGLCADVKAAVLAVDPDHAGLQLT